VLRCPVSSRRGCRPAIRRASG